MGKSQLLDLAGYQSESNDFAHLSLKDLLEAREQYHMHLMSHPNVVATAVGRYRIRIDDSWPNDARQRHGSGERRLENSEIRPYSWPCVTVFVSEWQSKAELAAESGRLIPPTLFMPDGRKVPVCVIKAPRESAAPIDAPRPRFPINNIGPGFPIVAEVQDRTYLATVGCLVSDGHRVYGLTNRHVTGTAGEPIYSDLDGRQVAIGVSSEKQLARLPFGEVYPALPGRDTFVNLDIGLIDIDDLHRWTTRVRGMNEPVGPMADFSGANLSLSLVGCWVRGVGAAGGVMLGEIYGLFYRYKEQAGSEYVADLFIGPRAPSREARTPSTEFQTLPGDSGTLWLLEPRSKKSTARAPRGETQSRMSSGALLPLAIQWGRNMLYSDGSSKAQSFALATLLSRVCDLLQVELVRDWNLDQTDTWGALGHFAIAARSADALSTKFPKLAKLMKNNARIISRDEDSLAAGDFKGMGSSDFVPMADVPDFFWKPRVAKQGHQRRWEGPNHFADMDQPDAGGRTLLDLTKEDQNIDPERWDEFYSSVRDLLSNEPIKPEHRGLLPFRVWQIFDSMVEFARAGEGDKFVCAAGVLAHYVGDASQPLHISYLHDGDPLRSYEYTFTQGKKAGTSEFRSLGTGVHSLYEDGMIHLNRTHILGKLENTPKVRTSDYVSTGLEAAKQTIHLMRETFKAVPPAEIVQAQIDFGHGGKAASTNLWKRFGNGTVGVMQAGTHLLAALWESAWAAGGGEQEVSSTAALSEVEAMTIVADAEFLPSYSISQVGKHLGRAPADMRSAGDRRAARSRR